MDRLGNHCHRAAARARRALSSLRSERPRAEADVTGCSARLEITFDQEFGAGAAGHGPTNLDPDIAHAGHGNLQPFPHPVVSRAVDVAAAVRKVAQPNRRLGAVSTVGYRVDVDVMPVFPPRPAAFMLHTQLPTRR